MFGFCKDVSLQLYSQLGNLVLVLCFVFFYYKIQYWEINIFLFLHIPNYHKICCY